MHKIIISLSLLTSITLAEENYTFIGLETSFVKYKNVSSPSVGLKYGVQNKMWRSSLSLEYAKDGQDSLTSFIFQADRGILKNNVKDSNFKPHIGFSVASIQHKNSKTERGFGYGVNTGVTYLLNQKVDLDLTYRYMKVNQIDALDSINNLNLSLHYFY